MSLVCSCIFHIIKSLMRYFFFFSFLFLVLCLLDLWVTVEHSDHECRCLDFLYVVWCIFALCILSLYYWVHLGFYHCNKTFTKSFYFQVYLFDIVFHTLLSSFIWSIFLTALLNLSFYSVLYSILIGDSVYLHLLWLPCLDGFLPSFVLFVPLFVSFLLFDEFLLPTQFCLSPLLVWKYMLFCMFF